MPTRLFLCAVFFTASLAQNAVAKDRPVDQITKSFEVSSKLLVIPIKNGGKEDGRLILRIDGAVKRDYRLAIAPSRDEVDWYASFDLSRYAGEQAELEVMGATEEGVSLIKQADEVPGTNTSYQESRRPQFHFTARTGWLNDPNGLIYLDGVYHLYFQHNPVSVNWGNMTWGHATSTDLVHWDQQPSVLFPSQEHGACYSGATFIDRWNQLGKQIDGEAVLVAFYLRTKIGLCLAYSNDGGQTFTDYEHNPVLTHDGARIDTPRPFWHPPTQRWVAPTYDFYTDQAGSKQRAVGFYSSANLTDWRYESRVEQGEWGDELCGCVDFFQLPVDGDPENKKWVMVFIDGSYIIGEFDGKQFDTLAGEPAATKDRVRNLVYPGHYYATMTWHNAPEDRRVQVTWMRKRAPTNTPFGQQLTVPSELTLHATPQGPRLRMYPIEELKTLRQKSKAWSDLSLKPGDNPLAGVVADAQDIEVEFVPSADALVAFNLRGTEVSYDAAKGELTLGNRHAPLQPTDGVIRLRLLLDRASIEVYGNEGRVYLPRIIKPSLENHQAELTCKRGTARITELRVHGMRSMWQQPN